MGSVGSRSHSSAHTTSRSPAARTASWKARTGARVDGVHFRGSGQAVPEVLSGRVPVMVEGVANMLEHIRGGAVRPLMVASDARSPVLPDVPTVAESGLPGYETQNWYGLYAPARTPRPVIDRLAAEVARAVADPDCRRRLVELGVEPVGSSPDAFAAQWRRELQVWEPVVRSSGARLD